MIYQEKTFQGSRVTIMKWHPGYNPSQVVRSPIGRRQALDDFTHKWYTDRGYKVIGAVNLSFFQLYDPTSLFLGLLARDSGFVDGVPNNGHEMWLTKDGQLHIAQLNKRGVAGIGDNWIWGASLAYQLVADSKIDIQGTNDFNFTEITNRTSFGQDSQGNIIATCATKADGRKMAEIMLSLGCVKAVMGDGGGSSQMIVNENKVFKSTREVGTALLIFGYEDARVEKQPTVSRRMNDIQLSENFKLYEFECKDGNHEVKIDPKLLELLQKLRTKLGKPITITSAYRTPEYNATIPGAAANSQHVLGKAADIKVSGLSPHQVADEAEKIGFTGIGIYSTFTHVDVRDTKSKWRG